MTSHLEEPRAVSRNNQVTYLMRIFILMQTDKQTRVRSNQCHPSEQRERKTSRGRVTPSTEALFSAGRHERDQTVQRRPLQHNF